ncbi:V-type ATP synthase subunit D [Qiania dongpingensis]|uniref:V-type ATP synthase subunit D n=1 Tax=Qiania dongpingensis TaxID=2763669 RepID=A0A7G9G0V1_9FIRM|nr:V-type ATP synthase subunit D [Qiania dongpingensis]QNM04433.1 V-type ATP synthase subunit D [Qiania dongpingensis]
MDLNTCATKGNLIIIKNSLALSKQGYELMDKKRNILIRELMQLIEKASSIQSEIDKTFTEAYASLQRAILEMGMNRVREASAAIPLENSVRVKTRSIMGTEIPLVEFEKRSPSLAYSFHSTNQFLDDARMQFEKVKELTLRLTTVENSAYRLSFNIKKTQKRANALKNITIPKYEALVHNIQNALEEKEREEFTRLKVIKRQADKKKSSASSGA